MLEKFEIDVSDAIEILQDPEQSIDRRESMIWILEQDGSARSIEALVSALTYDEFGVRWVAGTALARLGDRAIPFVLEEIMKHFSMRLRDSVYHVLHYNHGLWTQWHSGELMEALRGLVPDVSAPRAAYEMLVEYEHSKDQPLMEAVQE
ncbi:MAG: HEAT repeat domain-containing protein [Anaerolineales bacterium]